MVLTAPRKVENEAEEEAGEEEEKGCAAAATLPRERERPSEADDTRCITVCVVVDVVVRGSVKKRFGYEVDV